MTSLLLFVEEPLRVYTAQEPVFPRSFSGRRYEQDAWPSEVVFYDWLVDPADRVAALEVHLTPQHPLLQSSVPISRIDRIDIDLFPRFWLTPQCFARPQGIEAFDGIAFAHSADGRLAIAVNLDSWLSADQRRELLKAVPCAPE